MFELDVELELSLFLTTSVDGDDWLALPHTQITRPPPLSLSLSNGRQIIRVATSVVN